MINLFRKNPPKVLSPTIGEIRTGKEIGRTILLYCDNYIWQSCDTCKKEYWEKCQPKTSTPNHKICQGCRLSKIQLSKKRDQSRHIDGKGYVIVSLYPDSPFYEMVAKKNDKTVHKSIMEHRLIMAQHLGRCLKRYEIVHHKNRIRSDNRIENLELIDPSDHSNEHTIDRVTGEYVKKLEKQIAELKLEIEKLRSEKANLLIDKTSNKRIN